MKVCVSINLTVIVIYVCMYVCMIWNYISITQTHLKYEKNPRARDAITEKFKEYLERAETIRAMLDGKEQGNGSATTGSAAAQKAKPKGEKGEKDENESEKERMRMNLGGAIISEKPNVKVRNTHYLICDFIAYRHMKLINQHT